MMIATQPPAAGGRTAWGRVGIAICCFRTQAVRVVEFARRGLEPDDMRTYGSVRRAARRGGSCGQYWLLYRCSMPSAGHGEPELDVARAWGWPWMSLPVLLLASSWGQGQGQASEGNSHKMVSCWALFRRKRKGRRRQCIRHEPSERAMRWRRR